MMVSHRFEGGLNLQAAEQGTTADPAKKLSRSVTDVSPNVAVSHDIYLVYINKPCLSAGRPMIQRTEDLRRGCIEDALIFFNLE